MPISSDSLTNDRHKSRQTGVFVVVYPGGQGKRLSVVVASLPRLTMIDSQDKVGSNAGISANRNGVAFSPVTSHDSFLVPRRSGFDFV